MPGGTRTKGMYTLWFGSSCVGLGMGMTPAVPANSRRTGLTAAEGGIAWEDTRTSLVRTLIVYWVLLGSAEKSFLGLAYFLLR